MCIILIISTILLVTDSTHTSGISILHENIKSGISSTDNHPWIGLLRVKSGSTLDSATGLVLIAEAVALANANEVSKIDKESISELAKAIFFEGNILWNCEVIDYSLHPEFDKETLNTIALVFLKDSTKWKPVQWPINVMEMQWGMVFAVGISDEKKKLEQVFYSMLPVNTSTCVTFYRQEELDFKHIWPSNFLCFKAAVIKRECLFDAGMALVHKYNGIWKLIGLSIYGPGCKLPSRYIEFLPYIEWIKSNIQPGFTNDLHWSRRSDGDNNKTKPIDPGSMIVSDSYPVDDDFLVKYLNETTIELTRENATAREAVHGNCRDNKGTIMYREAGLIKSKGLGTGYFVLSLYDLSFHNITCVMVTVRCKNRSRTKFWYQKGFRKYDLENLIRIVPYPRIHMPTPWKILFLKDSYDKYEDMTVANILFKFEFINIATINVDFYGSRKRYRKKYIRPRPCVGNKGALLRNVIQEGEAAGR